MAAGSAGNAHGVVGGRRCFHRLWLQSQNAGSRRISASSRRVWATLISPSKVLAGCGTTAKYGLQIYATAKCINFSGALVRVA